jgi:hypothetical protein
LLVIACLAAPARAEPPAPRLETTADTAMRDYFAGERTGGYVLIGMGAVGLAAGGLLYAEGGDYTRGMSYSLLGVGALHVAAGAFVNLSSARRVRVFAGEIDDDLEAWVPRESKRMRGVSTQFLTLKIVETVLIAGGTTVAIVYRDDRPRLAGAGLGIAIEMASTLLFDIVAARRAHRYRHALGRIERRIAVGPRLQQRSSGLAISFAF